MIRKTALENVKNNLDKKGEVQHYSLCSKENSNKIYPKISSKSRGVGDPDGGDQHGDRLCRAEK